MRLWRRLACRSFGAPRTPCSGLEERKPPGAPRGGGAGGRVDRGRYRRARGRRSISGGWRLPRRSCRSSWPKPKPLAVSAIRPDAYCIGADQTLTLEGGIFHKSRDLAEGAQTLAALSGKTHRLTSAFCVARAGQALVVHRDHADLRMRALDPVEISRYLERAGRACWRPSACIRARALEFTCSSTFEGDHSVVLGLPMLSLLAWLRRENLISL